MNIILLHGPMGSGKSTVANMLKAQMGGEIISFAKPVKDAALSLGWNGEKDKKGRRLLQLLGTEVGRNCISPTIWSDKWLRAVGTSEHETIICDDLRFLSEYDAAKSLSPHCRVLSVKLKGRGYATNGLFKRALWHVRKVLGLLHHSELPLPDYIFDITYDNSKSFYHLDSLVEQIIYRIKA